MTFPYFSQPNTRSQSVSDARPRCAATHARQHLPSCYPRAAPLLGESSWQAGILSKNHFVPPERLGGYPEVDPPRQLPLRLHPSAPLRSHRDGNSSAQPGWTHPHPHPHPLRARVCAAPQPLPAGCPPLLAAAALPPPRLAAGIPPTAAARHRHQTEPQAARMPPERRRGSAAPPASDMPRPPHAAAAHRSAPPRCGTGRERSARPEGRETPPPPVPARRRKQEK